MANTFCSLNIHCIFSTKERSPMLNPELTSATVIANHSSHRQSHSMNKGWIIGLDSPDFSTTAQL
jgi:hypothetical protein